MVAGTGGAEDGCSWPKLATAATIPDTMALLRSSGRSRLGHDVSASILQQAMIAASLSRQLLHQQRDALWRADSARSWKEVVL